MLDIVILGLATATVAVTVAQSRLFAPVREWVEDRWEWGGELLGCPYCLGHWVAGILTLVITPITFPEVIIVWLAVTAVAALVSGAIGRLHES